MRIWESGRESGLIEDILAGKKTIEGRLTKGKFSKYSVGDEVRLRRDYRDKHGVLHDGEPDQLRVKVVGIRRYATFRQMLETEGYQNAIPSALSLNQAESNYEKFYSKHYQTKYGVLAIEIAVLN